MKIFENLWLSFAASAEANLEEKQEFHNMKQSCYGDFDLIWFFFFFFFFLEFETRVEKTWI